jgi:hypothetical protein
MEPFREGHGLSEADALELLEKRQEHCVFAPATTRENFFHNFLVPLVDLFLPYDGGWKHEVGGHKASFIRK